MKLINFLFGRKAEAPTEIAPEIVVGARFVERSFGPFYDLKKTVEVAEVRDGWVKFWLILNGEPYTGYGKGIALTKELFLRSFEPL